LIRYQQQFHGSSHLILDIVKVLLNLSLSLKLEQPISRDYLRKKP